MKYGELTICKEDILASFFSCFKSNDKYIFSFDEEIRDDIKDFQYTFFNSKFSVLPIYFENKQTYFKEKNPNFNKLFSLYSKYIGSVESDYNCIYYCYTWYSRREAFSMVRIKSSEDMPRYQFAYDDFTKEEVMYLIHTIFTHV